MGRVTMCHFWIEESTREAVEEFEEAAEFEDTAEEESEEPPAETPTPADD